MAAVESVSGREGLGDDPLLYGPLACRVGAASGTSASRKMDFVRNQGYNHKWIKCDK